MARAWILQANPTTWDVWKWWEEHAEEDLDRWTIARHFHDVSVGDHFALWISGKRAGIYATGKVTSQPYGPVEADGDYWLAPPQHTVWAVDLKTNRYFFDRPLLKENLRQDARFQEALILRMPGAANPIPLTPEEWSVIAGVATARGMKTRPDGSQPVLSALPLAEAPEDITVPTQAQDQNRSFREARLVKRYERSIGRPLVSKTIRLPSGERLVCDAYDDENAHLIEAKSSASRTDVRMAIGQLLDYRRYLPGTRQISILVPEEPSSDLADLAYSLGIGIIVTDQNGFREMRKMPLAT